MNPQQPSQPQQRPAQPNSAATELKALQKQIAALTTEVSDLRAELNKKLLTNPSDVVAIGVLKAGLALVVVIFVLQLIGSRI